MGDPASLTCKEAWRIWIVDRQIMYFEELPFVAPHELFHEFAHEAWALLLDSSSAATDRDPALHGRWSFIACDPYETLTLRDGDMADPFAPLSAYFAEHKLRQTDLPSMPIQPPFLGGLAGYFGYDLAGSLETLPPRHAPFATDDQHVPDMALGFYDLVLAFDMIEKRCILISTGLPEKTKAARWKRATERAGLLRERMAKARRFQPPAKPVVPAPLTSNFSCPAYETAVQHVIDYIHAGDIFQANLSQRFETTLASGDTAYALYLRLRNESPAPFSSFFNFGVGCLVSSSPERFLFCDADGHVETKPIKGTRKRGLTEKQDKALADELLSSAKDRAENVMIVDLLRNDLSRVCADSSVQVTALCALESFANVHHLVSTIEGQLHKDRSAVDLLAACFPGGSITGAPKIRAMEIIAELEPTTRGPYCGAIGYIGMDGAMDTSIAIRTMLVKQNRVTFQAGGGITADSDPVAEYEETLAKARAMAAALGLAVTPQETPETGLIMEEAT